MQQLFDELYEQISDKEALFTYLCALKMQENASLPARGAWIEIWKEMQAVRSVRIEACLYAIIDYYVTYAEEKPKGYTPHTNSGTHFGY